MFCHGLQAAGIMTLPFDVVKTRRQIQMGEMDFLRGSYPNMLTHKKRP